MAKKKSQRMFTRSQRAENRKVREAVEESMTQEQKDIRTIIGSGIDAKVINEPVLLAELWFGLKTDDWREAWEDDLLFALDRRFTYITGDVLNEDRALDYIDGAEEQRLEDHWSKTYSDATEDEL